MAGQMLALSRGGLKNEEKDDDGRHKASSQTIDALLAEVASKYKVQEKTTHWLIDSKPFQGTVFGFIILNAIQMGLAVDHYEEQDVWNGFEHLFTLAFLIEMMIKLHFLRKDYFSDGWNRLDCFLVCMSILDNWMIKPAVGAGSALSQLSVLRVLRILRVARLARLLKVFKELWIILKGILDSLRVMFWVTVLLLLTLYVCSIMCVDILGREQAGFEGYDDSEESIEASLQIAGWNNYQYFGTMGRSMYTLFNIVVVAEFGEIARPTLERQPAMIFFFLLFVIFTNFGVMNVIIGVIVDNTMAAAKGMEQDLATREKNEKLALLLRIRDMVFALDADGSGSISIEEVEEGWDLPELKDLLADVDLPKGWTAGELMCLLDADGDGELTFEEFMRSFYRLIASNPFQMNCCMHASLNEVKKGMLDIKDAISEVKDKQAEDLVYVTNLFEEMNNKLDRIVGASGTPKKKPPSRQQTDLLNGKGNDQDPGSPPPMTLPGMPLDFGLLDGGVRKKVEFAEGTQHLPSTDELSPVEEQLPNGETVQEHPAYALEMLEPTSHDTGVNDMLITILAEMASMRTEIVGLSGTVVQLGSQMQRQTDLMDESSKSAPASMSVRTSPQTDQRQVSQIQRTPKQQAEGRQNPSSQDTRMDNLMQRVEGKLPNGNSPDERRTAPPRSVDRLSATWSVV